MHPCSRRRVREGPGGPIRHSGRERPLRNHGDIGGSAGRRCTRSSAASAQQRDVDAGEDRRGDDAADVGAQGVRQDHHAGVGLGRHLLHDLGGGRHAADAGDADHRVVLAPVPEVHHVAADDAADAREQQRQDAEQQQLQRPPGSRIVLASHRMPSVSPRKNVAP